MKELPGHQFIVDRVARTILNARGARKGVPEIRNIEDLVGPELWRNAREDAIAALEALWLPFESYPTDGQGFLAFGLHDDDSGRAGGWVKGDHFWAIAQWDIWREPHQLVFGKDGAPLWKDPTHFQVLLPPKLSDGLING
jgi:hypothetical protein